MCRHLNVCPGATEWHHFTYKIESTHIVCCARSEEIGSNSICNKKQSQSQNMYIRNFLYIFPKIFVTIVPPYKRSIFIVKFMWKLFTYISIYVYDENCFGMIEMWSDFVSENLLLLCFVQHCIRVWHTWSIKLFKCDTMDYQIRIQITIFCHCEYVSNSRNLFHHHHVPWHIKDLVILFSCYTLCSALEASWAGVQSNVQFLGTIHIYQAIYFL